MNNAISLLNKSTQEFIQLFITDAKSHVKYIYDLCFPRKLSGIKISNYYSINKIVLKNLNLYNEVYFLGVNGVGKTLLLQSIIFSLVSRSNKYSSEVFDIDAYLDTQKVPESSFIYPNIFAYGVGRLKTHDNEIDETGYGTLFDQQRVNLKHPIRFLEEVERLELKGIGNLKLEKLSR